MAESTVTMRDMSSLPWALARCIGRQKNWRDFQSFYLEERVNVKLLLCQCRSEPRQDVFGSTKCLVD